MAKLHINQSEQGLSAGISGVRGPNAQRRFMSCLETSEDPTRRQYRPLKEAHQISNTEGKVETKLSPHSTYQELAVDQQAGSGSSWLASLPKAGHRGRATSKKFESGPLHAVGPLQDNFCKLSFQSMIVIWSSPCS